MVADDLKNGTSDRLTVSAEGRLFIYKTKYFCYEKQ